MIALQDIQPVVAAPDTVNGVDNEWDGSAYNKVSQEATSERGQV